jgi:tetratricopeptide (TPR) repeat protein
VPHYALTLALALAPAGPGDVLGSLQEASFDDVARRAAEARDARHTDEAIGLYSRGVEMRPSWDEGWWYLGSLLYEQDLYAEAVPAFRTFTELKPQVGAGWALLGLCEFEIARHEPARDHLRRGLSLGLGTNDDLLRVARRTFSFAAIKTGLFELAIEPLMVLSVTAPKTPELLDAIGLALLRMPLLPSEVGEARRDLVRRVGNAGFLQFSQSTEDPLPAFRAVTEAYADEPWVHYLYGVVLRRSNGDLALRELRRELQVQPDNVYAHLQIAFELLLRADPAGARPHAERAATLAPGLFAARHALGRVLLESGEVEASLRELEEAARLAPESAPTQFALAQAYARLGRKAESGAARTRFAELQKKQQARQWTSPGGGITEPSLP